LVRSNPNANSLKDLKHEEILELMLEHAIYMMFRINLRNLVKNKLFICKEYHLQPSEIDRLYYYEYEWILEEINILQKEQEKQNEAQQKEYDSMRSNMNMGKMMNNMKSSMPNMGSMKMPNMGQLKIPKF